MLRKITRNGQVSIPKKVLHEFQLQAGDYVDIESSKSAIRIKPVTVNELSSRDYETLAAKLTEVEKERGLRFPDSDSARKHLNKLTR